MKNYPLCDFQFLLSHQRAIFKCQHTFRIYGHLVKKHHTDFWNIGLVAHWEKWCTIAAKQKNLTFQYIITSNYIIYFIVCIVDTRTSLTQSIFHRTISLTASPSFPSGVVLFSTAGVRLKLQIVFCSLLISSSGRACLLSRLVRFMDLHVRVVELQSIDLRKPSAIVSCNAKMYSDIPIITIMLICF